jgi:RNA polymerase sigma-70 factor, ECF subfamily
LAEVRPTPPPREVDRLVDGLFRRASGRLVSTLARKLGAHHIDLAQECVQDALAQALHSWPYGGVPDEPEAWLYRVAANRAIDALRRDNLGRAKLSDPTVLDDLARGSGSAPAVDDELAMMFMCCHPDIPLTHRVALTLKTVGGLSVEEIAAAFLVDSSTLAQRLVRAKRQIRDQQLALEVPEPSQLSARLESLLEAIYLLFNEGYSAHSGDQLVRSDLCFEAIRLARLLVADSRTNKPQVRALLALMLFHGARESSRISGDGSLLLLADQDRTQWNSQSTAEAFRVFEQSMVGPKTAYHVEAAIASVHAAARSFGQTNWTRVRELYDELLLLKPTPVVALNRAIAIGHEVDPTAGLAALHVLATDAHLARYHLLPAAQAAFSMAIGAQAQAAQFYRAAIELAPSVPEKRLLQAKLNACLDGRIEGVYPLDG